MEVSEQLFKFALVGIVIGFPFAKIGNEVLANLTRGILSRIAIEALYLAFPLVRGPALCEAHARSLNQVVRRRCKKEHCRRKEKPTVGQIKR